MPSRFEFERAIKRSDLPPLARLIAFVIASWADADTGTIARKNQPAQSVLMEATGMSKSAFLSHRKTLIDAGWVKCVSPDKIKAQKEYAQNVYSIHIPGGWARSGDDLAFPGQVGYAPVGARSGDDLAQSEQNGTSPDQARSGDDLGLGRQATQPKPDDVRNAPEKLGRQATTRVFPSSVTPLLQPDDGKQASSGSNEDRIPDAFAYIQPLIAAMTNAGFRAISWQMQPDDTQSVARVLRRTGITAMVESAVNAKATARTPIRYATYFLKSGWVGLPPKSTAPPPTRQAGKPPWCEDPDCDPITRTRDIENDRGLRFSQPCAKCHPNRKAPAA